MEARQARILSWPILRAHACARPCDTSGVRYGPTIPFSALHALRAAHISSSAVGALQLANRARQPCLLDDQPAASDPRAWIW